MIWYLTIPFIVFFTFKNMIQSDFPDGSHRNFLEWAFLLIVSTFFSALLSLIPFGVSCLIGSIPKVTGIADAPYPLIALREKDGTTGRFFLGSGTINDSQYYFWYRRAPDGSVRGGKTYREAGVRIWESDDPHMTTFHPEYKNVWAKKLLWLVGTDLRDTETFCPDFYIPKGSIKEGFEL
jgi:hypothetical protein